MAKNFNMISDFYQKLDKWNSSNKQIGSSTRLKDTIEELNIDQ